MANLQDIFNLVKADGGKFFVIDEKGDVKLVIMDVDGYQAMLLGKIQKQAGDVETINRQILEAQLHESELTVPEVGVPKQVIKVPKVENNSHLRKYVDLREEVIDPSFDFEGPKMDDDF